MINPQLKTFLTVCEKKSFTRAAAELYITPSAVLQQINALEKHLDVDLVVRHRSGITLTPAGAYLEETAREWFLRDRAVKAELLSIAQSENTISFGTSLLEKCRLLYELWMIYADRDPRVKINMVTLTQNQPIPPETDLIESINSDLPWMQEWNFLEICRMPLGFAVDRRHPLCAKQAVDPGDLAGETVVCFKNVNSQVLQKTFAHMESSGIRLLKHDYPRNSVMQASAFYHQILLVPLCWEDFLVNMKVLPCRWPYTLPYGIFYRRDPSPVVRKFLQFIRKTYEEGNDRDLVPVL